MKVKVKVKVVKEGVTLENGVLSVGSELDLPEKLAQRLVDYACAEILEEVADDTEELKAALDAKYKADELKAKAVDLGMEPVNGISKKDLIEAIVAAGKADDFLQ